MQPAIERKLEMRECARTIAQQRRDTAHHPVGIGVDPGTLSFGTMINSARMELAREPMVWWSLAAAFVFMVTLVLAANLFADAVRDAFDPRVRTGAGFGKRIRPAAIAKAEAA